MKSGKKIFRPRARIIKSLGDELISNEFVAISELIKNSHDAGASYVKIDIQEDSITIEDNGKGMTLCELQEGWFEPATNINVKNKKLLGEKGIGRFSVVKLASHLELNTKSENENAITSLFNWEDFNKENSYLDEVEVEWSECEWKYHNKTGTVLKLTELKDDWSNADPINYLKSFLSRMVSPFEDVKYLSIELKVLGESEYKKVEPSEVLKHPNYRAQGVVNNGLMTIDYSGLDNRKKTIEKKLDENLFPCGYFCIGRYPKIGTPFLKSVNNTRRPESEQTAVAIA
jgi:HSP90 family molecular chaperone